MKNLLHLLFICILFTINPFNKLSAQTSEASEILINPSIEKYKFKCSIEFSPAKWNPTNSFQKTTGYKNFTPSSESSNANLPAHQYSGPRGNNELTGCQEIVGGLAKLAFTLLSQ